MSACQGTMQATKNVHIARNRVNIDHELLVDTRANAKKKIEHMCYEMHAKYAEGMHKIFSNAARGRQRM